MASLKEIAREYRDEIMDGIAWVAIWKTGRSWNAKAFWLNLETERIEDEEMEEAREIVAADPKAIFINEYYTAHMGEGKLDEIVEGIRFMYENEYNLLANNTVEKREATISELNTELCNARAEAKANEIPEELVQEMYCMAYDKEAEADGKMEKAADRMAAVIIAGEDVCGFAEEYKKQKENRSRYRKVMEELDKRERRRAGRE